MVLVHQEGQVRVLERVGTSLSLMISMHGSFHCAGDTAIEVAAMAMSAPRTTGYDRTT